MLKGSAAVFTPGREKRAERNAWSHQLANVAAESPAVAYTPCRKENPQAGTKPPGLVTKTG